MPSDVFGKYLSEINRAYLQGDSFDERTCIFTGIG